MKRKRLKALSDVLLKVWSSVAEQPIDEEDTRKVSSNFWLDVIAKLEILHNDNTNPTLATALNGIAKLSVNLGFSIKVVPCFIRALL